MSKEKKGRTAISKGYDTKTVDATGKKYALKIIGSQVGKYTRADIPYGKSVIVPVNTSDQARLVAAKLSEIKFNGSSSLDNLKFFINLEYELSKTIFRMMAEHLEISDEQWSEILNVPLSRISSPSKFNHHQSIHVLSVLIFYNYGISVFGNIKKLLSWLNTKNEYYQNSEPAQFLKTGIGISLLYDDLVKVEYGFVA